MNIVSRDTIAQLVKEVKAPVSILARPENSGVAELQKLGVARVSYGVAFTRAAISAVRWLAAEIQKIRIHHGFERYHYFRGDGGLRGESSKNVGLKFPMCNLDHFSETVIHSPGKPQPKSALVDFGLTALSQWLCKK